MTLTVGVDDSSIEINSDALRVKASGITNAMLAGSIANSKLANSSVTINSQAISLGGSHTFDSDDIGEGASNLYFTNERVDDRVAELYKSPKGKRKGLQTVCLSFERRTPRGFLEFVGRPKSICC